MRAIIQNVARKNGNVYIVKMEKTFYVYIDTKPNGEVFYVGKGNARRVKQERRNRHHTFIVNKYKDWKREIVFTGTEEDCLLEETRLIKKYGRIDIGTGTLVNLCDGGKGNANFVRSESEVKRLSDRWKAEANPLFNNTVYNWINVDTQEKAASTIFNMHKQFGGCRAHWTSVVNGDRKTHKGWTLKGTIINVRSSKGKKFTFYNIDGTKFVGTQDDLTKIAKISCASASRIVNQDKITKGWYVKN